ncbi:hypothetical protein CLOM_g10916 [Closterium sp. NIES-68]|nr:hypothetical protein CLOM_g10916 [Closterium sp. NIES-68]GJP57780.1 hypothetical protein CLOP_g17374 [Closterium sp. NIES-67]
MAFPDEHWRRFGPLAAGALFGAAWWIWVDAVVCNSTTVPFLHYVPGIFAALAAMMFNAVHRDELLDYSPYDDGAGCRSRTWLFLAYVIAFASLAGAAGLLIKDASPPSTSSWPGAAGVFQCAFIIGSGLLYWLSRSSESSPSYY